MEKDIVKSNIENIVKKASEPLETKEIQEKLQKNVGDVSRSKLFYRLNLRINFTDPLYIIIVIC